MPAWSLHSSGGQPPPRCASCRKNVPSLDLLMGNFPPNRITGRVTLHPGHAIPWPVKPILPLLRVYICSHLFSRRSWVRMTELVVLSPEGCDACSGLVLSPHMGHECFSAILASKRTQRLARWKPRACAYRFSVVG